MPFNERETYMYDIDIKRPEETSALARGTPLGEAVALVGAQARATQRLLEWLLDPAVKQALHRNDQPAVLHEVDWHKDEGDTCPVCAAEDLTVARSGDCSCHISPPCGSCTDAALECTTCGARSDDAPMRNGALYRHYKGDVYRVLGQCQIEETNLPGVRYQLADGTGKEWVRSLLRWQSYTEQGTPRFALIRLPS